MQKFITADQDIETKDIMYALTGALPAAVESLERLNLPEFKSPEAVARYLQQNVQYKEDGLDEQLIQLPTALLNSGVGDCKSFALFISSVLTKYNVNNGFRFVAYAPGDVTHVYNFYRDQSGNTVYLDACLNNLNEAPNYVKKIDMQVGVIGKSPIVYKAGSKIGSRIGVLFTRTFMRQAFLALLKLNYRGYADVFSAMRANHANGSNPVPWLQLSALWVGSLNGNINNLNIAIDQGRGKNPLFGRGNAADQAYLADQYNTLQNELGLAELLGTAVNAGYQLDPLFKSNTPGPTFGKPTADWQLIFPGASNPPANWPQFLTALIQSINAFFVAQGNALVNALEGGPAVDITTLPTMPVQTVAPGSGPGRNRVAVGSLGGVEGAVALMAAAAPVILAVSQLLKQLGLDEAADTLESVAGNIPIDGSGSGGNGGGGGGGNGDGTGALGLSMPMLLLLGFGALFLLTNKKR